MEEKKREREKELKEIAQRIDEIPENVQAFLQGYTTAVLQMCMERPA